MRFRTALTHALIAVCGLSACSSDECGIAFVHLSDGRDVTHVVLHDESGALLEDAELSLEGDALFACKTGYQVTVIHEFSVPLGIVQTLIQTFTDLEPGVIVPIGAIRSEEMGLEVDVSTRAEGIPADIAGEVKLYSGCRMPPIPAPSGTTATVDLRCFGDDRTRANVLAVSGSGGDRYYSAAYDIPTDGSVTEVETGPWLRGLSESLVTEGPEPVWVATSLVLDGVIMFSGRAGFYQPLVSVPPAGIADGMILDVHFARSSKRTDLFRRQHVSQWFEVDAPLLMNVTDNLPSILRLDLVEEGSRPGVSIVSTESLSDVDMTYARLFFGDGAQGEVTLWDVRGAYRDTVWLPQLPAPFSQLTDREHLVGEFHHVDFVGKDYAAANKDVIVPDNYTDGFSIQVSAPGERVRETILFGSVPSFTPSE